MGRAPCCSENGDLKKGPWTPEEDQLLTDYIQKHGHDSWRALPKLAGLNRCGKSCRLRWINYLRPDIKRGKFSEDEENLIINLHSALGNKWSRIASQLPGRTDNEIKNFWNTRIRKKLLKAGVDPNTHTPVPILSFLANVISQLTSSSSNIPFKVPTTMSPWINRYPSNASDQLTNINDQLLHNILQLLNTTPLPNALKSAFLDSQCSFNQHDGQLLLDEMMNQFAMNPSEDWLQNLNKVAMEPHSDQCNSIGGIGSFMESFGDGIGAADSFSTDHKSLSDNFFIIENQLPSLLPIDEPTDNKVISINNSPEFNVVRAGFEDYYDSLRNI